MSAIGWFISELVEATGKYLLVVVHRDWDEVDTRGPHFLTIDMVEPHLVLTEIVRAVKLWRHMISDRNLYVVVLPGEHRRPVIR
jgi:hypothetical protein